MCCLASQLLRPSQHEPTSVGRVSESPSWSPCIYSSLFNTRPTSVQWSLSHAVTWECSLPHVSLNMRSLYLIFAPFWIMFCSDSFSSPPSLLIQGSHIPFSQELPSRLFLSRNVAAQYKIKVSYYLERLRVNQTPFNIREAWTLETEKYPSRKSKVPQNCINKRFLTLNPVICVEVPIY